jgi:hypothetical protein
MHTIKVKGATVKYTFSLIALLLAPLAALGADQSGPPPNSFGVWSRGGGGEMRT